MSTPGYDAPTHYCGQLEIYAEERLAYADEARAIVESERASAYAEAAGEARARGLRGDEADECIEHMATASSEGLFNELMSAWDAAHPAAGGAA